MMNDWNNLVLGEEDSQTAPVYNGTVREMIADIDRLKGELEEVTKIREYLEIHTCLTHNLYLVGQTTCPACELERQLDASQALLAEAEYQIEKQTIETRAATQLASDYIKQLAEARAEVERLNERLQANGAKIDDEGVVIEWTDYLKLKEQARREAARECYIIAQNILVRAMKCDNFIGNAMDDLLDEIKDKFGLEVEG